MYTEKSPLTGGTPTYQNPSRHFKKQVKQFQCLLCAAVISLFALALITAVIFSVDEDEIDNMVNGNASLEGKLQASPGAPGKPPKPPKPIKLYTSGTVVKGSATGGFEGEGATQIFDGNLPVTIHLDSIIDPNGWSASTDLTWSGVVLHNDTVKGTFSLPAKVMNGTEEISKTFKADFEITMTFKWSANLDIVIPNKVYKCKAVFVAAYKSSMDNDASAIAQSTTKGKTDLTVETCNVLFQGSFYEKSFFCYITPWWCTDEKLFYWNGGLEFKITKPPPPPPPPSTTMSPNALQLQASPEDGKSVYMGAKILGTVTSGWVTIMDDAGTTQTIWNGEIPGKMDLSMFQGLMKGLTWTATVSSNSLKGTFKLMQNTASGTPKLLEGSFFFMLESDPMTSLASVLESGVEYTSTLTFKEISTVFSGTQIIYFISHNSSSPLDGSGYKAPVTVSGKFDSISKMFTWDGRVQIIAMKITKNVTPPTIMSPNALQLKASSEDDKSVYMGAQILGTVMNGWVTIIDDAGTTQTIWNGEIPGKIDLPMVQGLKKGVTWMASVSSNSIRGTFKLMQTSASGTPKLLDGSFFFMLESDPMTSLASVLESGVEYTSTLTFKPIATVFNGTQIIDFISHNSSSPSDGSGYKAPVTVSGKYDYISKMFMWDGKFQMIAMKISKNSNALLPDAPQPAKPILGASPWDWTAYATRVGSKLIGKVVSGWLTIQDESGTKTVWNGEFPADINAPMFFNPTTNITDLSDEYGHGAVWSCSVFHSSLRGSFQLPQYTRFGLVKWLKGSFFFQLESDPSWSLYDAVYPGVNYNSPIHFRNSDEPFNGTKVIPFYSHNPEAGAEDMGYIAPIFLLGKASKTSKAFSWDGRFEMIIKKMWKSPNGMLKSSADGSNDVPKPGIQPMPSQTMPLKALPGETVGSKLIGKVSSGWVTLQDDSGSKTIWNGELPAAINAPMFYNPTTNDSELSDEYGHGAIWSCSVFHSSLRGSFQLPQYTKFGLVKWLKGSFFFQLESDPSWSLYDVIYPGINYNSPIHFRNSDQPYNGSKLIQFYSHGAWGAFEDLGYKAHITLLGKSDNSSKAFTWDGRFEMIVKNDFKNIDGKTGPTDNQVQVVTERPVLNKIPKEALAAVGPSLVGLKLLGKVSSGWLSVMSDSGTRTIWNGELPAKISAPLFYNATTDTSELTDKYGHGAIWSCSVFHNTLKGSFQLPQYSKVGLVKWVKGNFYFQLEPTPDWSTYDALVPGINYYSPIHFRAAGKNFNKTKAINLYSYSQASNMDNLGFRAPIFLLGQGQGKGKTRSFTWDGRFVVVAKKIY